LVRIVFTLIVRNFDWECAEYGSAISLEIFQRLIEKVMVVDRGIILRVQRDKPDPSAIGKGNHLVLGVENLCSIMPRYWMN